MTLPKIRTFRLVEIFTQKTRDLRGSRVVYPGCLASGEVSPSSTDKHALSPLGSLGSTRLLTLPAYSLHGQLRKGVGKEEGWVRFRTHLSDFKDPVGMVNVHP